MRIQTQGPGPHPDFSIDGAVVAVGEAVIDCAERQADIQVVVDLRVDGGEITEGGSGRQVASIHIPPRRYEIVEADAPAGDSEASEERHAVPLDPNQVLVTIWTR